MTAAPQPYAPVSTPSTSDRRAVAAIIAAGLAVAIVVAGQVTSQFVPLIMQSADLSGSAVWLIFLPFQLGQAVFSILAIALAIGPLTGSGPKALAGAAAGIGSAFLLTLVLGVLASGVVGVIG
jgi:hypothetical protein